MMKDTKVTKNKIVVKSKDVDDNEVIVFVKRPNRNQLQRAQLEATKVFANAIQGGALLRAKLADYMKQQGLWSDEKDAKLKELVKLINQGERTLSKGGIKKSEARSLALDMRQWRMDQLELLSAQRSLDGLTAEGQSENSRFDCLVSLCVLSEDGNRMFANLDDYNNKADNPWAVDAASKLANLIYDFDEDHDKSLPENKFLLDYNFINEDLHLVNGDGKTIDLDGRLVDEKSGRYINDDGDYIDIEGNLVNKDGSPKVEFQEFLDD